VKAERGGRPSKGYFPSTRDTPRLGENLNPEYSSSIESASFSFAATTFCVLLSQSESRARISVNRTAGSCLHNDSDRMCGV